MAIATVYGNDSTENLELGIESAQPKMPAFSTSEAMAMLWENCSELFTHELEWLASGAADQACNDTKTLASVLMNLACLVSGDDKGSRSGSFLDSEGASSLLFNLSSQVSTLNVLANISANASQMLKDQS